MCFLTGLNANTIQNGVVAVLTVTATSGTMIGVTDALSASAAGNALETIATGGTVSVQAPTAPTVATGSASAVTSNSATLGGSVNPNGADTHVWFQYSTNSSMTGSTSTPQQDIGSGTSMLPFSANITGLAGNTTYYFRAWASNSAGTNQGSTANFIPTTLTISGTVTLSGSGLSGVAVTLSGSQSGTAATDGSGHYSFNTPAGGNYAVALSLAGYTFSPPVATFSNLSTNQTANFTAQCANSVSPSSPYLDSTSQAGPTLDVTASPGYHWTASGGGFITVTSGATGTGNGAVTFAVAANSSGAVRTGTLTVAGQTVTVTQRATAEIFADVTPPDYYFDFADIMYQAGITAGCTTTPLDYCPSSPTTRGEMAKFLILAVEGGNSFTYTTTPYFTDVPASSPYFVFIQKLMDMGITDGCTAATYCPNDAVTRGEMAAFIIRSRYETTPYTYPSTPYFTDVPPSNLFFPFIQKLAQAGITDGCAPEMYCPDETLTRGQMAVFLVIGLLNDLPAPGTPLIASAVPNSAAPGQSVTVTLTGVNTNFVQGTTQVVAPAGVTPSNITVLSGTSLTVDLAVGAGVAPNPTSIVILTGTEEAVLPNGFLVQ